MKSGMPVSVSYSISGPALIIVILFVVLVVAGLAFFIYKKLTVKKIGEIKKEEPNDVVETIEEVVPTTPTPVDNQQYEAPTFDNQLNQAPLNNFEGPVMQQPGFGPAPVDTSVQPGFGPVPFDGSIPPQATITNGLEQNVGVAPVQPPFTDANQNINQNTFNNNNF